MAAQASKPTKTRGRPKNTPEKTVVRLKASGLTEREISAATNLPKTTVHDIIHRLYTPEQLYQFRTCEADELTEKRAEILRSIDQETIKRAGLKEKSLAYGVLYDKWRLATDQSTSNIASIHADIAALKGRPNVDKPVDNPSCQPLPAVHEVKS